MAFRTAIVPETIAPSLQKEANVEGITSDIIARSGDKLASGSKVPDGSVLIFVTSENETILNQFIQRVTTPPPVEKLRPGQIARKKIIALFKR